MDSPKYSEIKNVLSKGISIGSLREWVLARTQLLLRVSVALAIILASAFFARHPSVMTLLVIVGMAGVLIIMRWPLLGLAGVIIGGLVVPIGIGTGSESELNPPILLLVLLMGISLLEMVRRREIQRVTSRTVLPLVVFLGATFLSFGVGAVTLVLCRLFPDSCSTRWIGYLYTLCRRVSLDVPVGERSALA